MYVYVRACMCMCACVHVCMYWSGIFALCPFVTNIETGKWEGRAACSEVNVNSSIIQSKQFYHQKGWESSQVIQFVIRKFLLKVWYDKMKGRKVVKNCKIETNE